MQGEFYADLRPHQKGHASFDVRGSVDEAPTSSSSTVRFNALTGERTADGEGGRAGTHLYRQRRPQPGPSSFHVIGEIFDVVHKEGASEASTNVQTTLIPAGGAAWSSLPSTCPAITPWWITRSTGRWAREPVAVLHVEGPENPEVYHELGSIGSGGV